MLSLGEEVEDLDKTFEFFRVSCILGQQLLIKEILVVKLSDLSLLINHSRGVCVPVSAG
jgi:hypothetical protein